MQKWEYCALTMNPAGLGRGIKCIQSNGKRTKVSGNQLDDAIITLNELGKVGYEVVGFNFTAAPNLYVWTLKRPIG